MVMVASDDMLFWKSPVASECITMVKSGVAQFMSMTMWPRKVRLIDSWLQPAGIFGIVGILPERQEVVTAGLPSPSSIVFCHRPPLGCGRSERLIWTSGPLAGGAPPAPGAPPAAAAFPPALGPQAASSESAAKARTVAVVGFIGGLSHRATRVFQTCSRRGA